MSQASSTYSISHYQALESSKAAPRDRPWPPAAQAFAAWLALAFLVWAIAHSLGGT